MEAVVPGYYPRVATKSGGLLSSITPEDQIKRHGDMATIRYGVGDRSGYS